MRQNTAEGVDQPFCCWNWEGNGHRVRTAGWLSLACLMLTIVAFLCDAARSEESNSTGTSASGQIDNPNPDAANPPEDRETEKQRRAMAGLVVLCGILLGGLVFVVLVMVWGNRLRRMIRADLPAQKTLQKDLWFLKPSKSSAENSGQTPSNQSE